MAHDEGRQTEQTQGESLRWRFDRVYGVGYFNQHVAQDEAGGVSSEVLADLQSAERMA